MAELKAEGKPIPFGRKKGGRNRSREERQPAAWEKAMRARVAGRFHQSQDAPRPLRAQQRRERKSAAADAARLERFQAGGPFWTDEEWEASVATGPCTKSAPIPIGLGASGARC
jgi:hypothetical protein